MKKTTILAVSLVVAAAFSAAWFARDRDVSSASENLAPAGTQLPLPQDVTFDAPQVATDGGPIQLFSVPDRGLLLTSDYQETERKYYALLTGFDMPPLRSEIVTRNAPAIAELARQIESNPAEFTTPFEIFVLGRSVCTIRSIERTYPKFTPDIIPNQYSAEAGCGFTARRITVAVDKAQGTVNFGMAGGNAGGIGVVTIDDSPYSVAYEQYPAF